MPKYNWEARTKTGGSQKGVIEAASVEMVEAQLKKFGFTNITISEAVKGLSFKLPKFGGGGKIATKDLVVFTRQFATMIDSGLPLVQCLDILANQQENKTFQDILHKAGYRTLLRNSRGADIAAACGQLATSELAAESACNPKPGMLRRHGQTQGRP